MPQRLLFARFKPNKKNIGFLLLIVVFFGLILFYYSLFSVKTVEVVFMGGKIPLRSIDQYKNQNLLFLSAKNLEEEIRQNNSRVESVSVEKKYPDRLRIFVRVNDAAALLIVNEGVFSLSIDGRIIAKRKIKIEKPALFPPVIYYYQKLNYEDYSAGLFLDNKDIKLALNLLDKLVDLGFLVDSIDIDGTDMIRFHIQKKSIIFSSMRQASIQQYELEQIIRRFKIQGTDFETIDLRFNKPIIKLKKQ